MHLPYLQIATELVEQAAPDISIRLDADESKVGWGLIKMIRWGLGRCPDHLPPSESSTVKGDIAARLIARAAGHSGDAEAFVDACCHASPAILERVPDGVRFRGFGRYDAAWEKARGRSAKAKAAADARWNASPMLGGCSADAQVMPRDAKTQTQTQTQTQKKEALKPPTPLSGEPAAPDGAGEQELLLSPEQQEATSAVSEVMAYYCEAMAANRKRARDSPKNRKLIADRLKEGVSVPELKTAVDGLFHSDHHFKNGFLGLKYAMRNAEQVDMMVERVPADRRTHGRGAA